MLQNSATHGRGIPQPEVDCAIPSADRRAMRRIVERCWEAAVTMKIVPGWRRCSAGGPG